MNINIIKQLECERQGNDCWIHTLYTLIEWDGTYIVGGYRRHHGWCDHGALELCSRKFKELKYAEAYFEHLMWIENDGGRENYDWKGHFFEEER